MSQLRHAVPILLTLVVAWAAPASAQTVRARLAAGGNPAAVAVDPVANRIYVANMDSASVTVIDGASNAASKIAAGTNPSAIAVNPATKRVYVANQGSDTVTVIDGATGSTTTVAVGSGPIALAVNPSTNRIYVANRNGTDITVIDGASNAVSAIHTGGTLAMAIAVNPVTDKVYVANFSSNTVSVVNGAAHALEATIAVPRGPGRVAVNPVTNKVYIGSFTASGEITVLDGGSNAATVVTMPAGHGGFPIAMAVNPVTNRLYVAFSAEIGILEGIGNAMGFVGQVGAPAFTATGYRAVGIDTVANKIYVPNGDGFLAVVDGDSNAVTSLAISAMAQYSGAVGVNPLTHRIYVVNPDVTLVEGAADDRVHVVPLYTTIAQGAPDASGAANFTFSVDSRFGPIAPPVRRVYYQLDSWQGAWSEAAGNGTFSASVGGLAAGNHTLYAFAVDGQDATAATTGPQSAPIVGALASYAFSVATATPLASATNVQGLWWASPAGVESGWGINLTQQGDILFATWFTYDLDGSPLWLVMSHGARTGTSEYSGTLYRATGPAFNAATFDSSQVRPTAVGTASFAFTDGDNGVFSYTVNGVSGRKSITREYYASPAPTCALGGPAGSLPNYQDLWWHAPAGSESGWGINITHQGDILFLTWFTYGVDGKALWLVASNLARTGNATYEGTLYRTAGPPYSADPWRSANVTPMAVGRVSLQFSDANNAVFTSTVDGVAQSRSITREAFASPTSVCR